MLSLRGGGPSRAGRPTAWARVGEAFVLRGDPACDFVELRLVDGPPSGVVALRVLGAAPAARPSGALRGSRPWPARPPRRPGDGWHPGNSREPAFDRQPERGNASRRRAGLRSAVARTFRGRLSERARRLSARGRALMGWIGTAGCGPVSGDRLRCPVGWAAGVSAYLPAARAARVRIGGLGPAHGVRLRLEHVANWPLRAPLVAGAGAVTAYGSHPDPRGAVRRAAQDLIGYLTAIRALPREGACALLGLAGDARLVLPAPGRRGDVLAEVGLAGGGRRVHGIGGRR